MEYHNDTIEFPINMPACQPACDRAAQWTHLNGFDTLQCLGFYFNFSTRSGWHSFIWSQWMCAYKLMGVSSTYVSSIPLSRPVVIQVQTSINRTAWQLSRFMRLTIPFHFTISFRLQNSTLFLTLVTTILCYFATLHHKASHFDEMKFNVRDFKWCASKFKWLWIGEAKQTRHIKSVVLLILLVATGLCCAVLAIRPIQPEVLLVRLDSLSPQKWKRIAILRNYYLTFHLNDKSANATTLYR